MMSHDHISLGVLQICWLENDWTAVLVVVTERVSGMESAIACTLGQKLWHENLCQTLVDSCEGISPSGRLAQTCAL